MLRWLLKLANVRLAGNLDFGSYRSVALYDLWYWLPIWMKNANNNKLLVLALASQEFDCSSYDAAIDGQFCVFRLSLR
jgi:hypothetical protein